jgi:hypothetical protein
MLSSNIYYTENRTFVTFLWKICMTMPYEYKKQVKSVTTTVVVVQEDELNKTVAEEVKVEDPVDAEKIVEEAVNGTKKTRVHKKNIEESGAEV